LAEVLLVEDDTQLADVVRLYMEDAGFRVAVARDGLAGMQCFGERRPDLVILDLMLPGLDGWQVCRRIRAESRVPVLMLTARGDEEDRVRGFELGADDYVVKPFLPRELVARVRALLRRRADNAEQEREQISFPGLSVDRTQFSVFVGGVEVALTPKEFDLLWLLASHPGRAFQRDHLLERVWGYDYAGDAHTLEVHVGRLREKLERGLPGQRWIKTVWGIGYKFEPPVAVSSGAGAAH